MNILVLESSPHKHGSSNHLADCFMQGATDAGHIVSVIDVAKANLHPCLGCDACGMAGPCCQKDDLEQIKQKILAADMVVFVTPLYYFGMSAQLKTLIDRFYSFNGELASKRLKTALIVAAWNEDSWTMKDVEAHYHTLCRYLHFQNQSTLLGTGCGTLAMTKQTIYPKLAYDLGKSL